MYNFDYFPAFLLFAILEQREHFFAACALAD